MGTVIPLKPKPSAKLGFQRARRRRKKREVLEKLGQLNLFSIPARVRRIGSSLSPFEQALLLDDRGDPEAAERYRQAITEGDFPADAFCNLGILESGAGHKGKAFDCFTRSLKLEPRHFESHYNLANLYFDMGDYHLAHVHYELAREIQPSFANLYYNLGLVQAVEKRYPEAVQNLIRYCGMADTEEARRAKELADRIIESVAMDGT